MAVSTLLAATLASCGATKPAAGPLPRHRARSSPTSSVAVAPVAGKSAGSPTSVTAPGGARRADRPSLRALPPPRRLAPFAGEHSSAVGAWRPFGRLVGGKPAVYETSVLPPRATQSADLAWMDTRLLSARLYSGSMSPGGGPYRYTAPIRSAQATSLVAAFNGGFLMKDANGGYYTEGRTVVPLRVGAASLVIYRDGNVDVRSWGGNVSMTNSVVSVRQNLVLLVADGQPTPAARSTDWPIWGNTCGATSCAPSVPGVDHQWRSGVGVTSDGALVYATGPALDPLQLAQILARAGVVRGMELDINPSWTVFVTYHPASARGLATPANGRRLLPSTMQGPQTFFEPWWARDFVTMSARRAPG